MAKKGAKIELLYVLGMALVVIGFCVPIFQSAIGKVNGFKLVGNGNSATKLFTLLIFIGGVAGLAIPFLQMIAKIPQARLLKIAALLISIIGLVVVIVISYNSKGAGFARAIGAGKNVVTSIFKSFYVGAYLIIIGWVVAIAGLVTKK